MKRYIDDFVEDLNYRKVILYIGNLDSDSLRSKMESDNMGHTNRFAIIFGYTAYRISKELSSAFVAVKAINCGMMLEATGNEKR